MAVLAIIFQQYMSGMSLQQKSFKPVKTSAGEMQACKYVEIICSCSLNEILKLDTICHLDPISVTCVSLTELV